MSDWPATHSQACFDVISRRCVCPLGNREARIERLAPEMETLLRECETIHDREDDPITDGCHFLIECSEAKPDDVNSGRRPCWRCRRRALLARIDAPLKEGL